MTVYQPGIPTGLVLLDEDYANIQGNFQQLDTSFGVDHVKFSEATSNGYHNQISFAINQAAPGIGTGVAELFANEASGNSWPFWQNALGTFQILGPVTASSTGTTTLPGGIILKWGMVTSPPRNGSVRFSPAFTNCFNVQLTTLTDEGDIQGFWIDSDVSTPISASKFYFAGSSGSLDGLYWFAIGN